jgi:undecaprenyl phosphate N,N'-diacetylbacillosamine 1-phosphate transferase
MYINFFKRSIDIFFALICLPILLLIFIIVAPFIVLTDKGPIFYNAERIGKNGKLFKMYKFRSMLVNAPDIRLPDGSTYNGEDDPRVTKIGEFLRKTSLDEAPQILNVLKGDMSLIGPRPDPPDWIDRYSDEVRIFLRVRPGITGYSQAYFRNSADGEEKMKNDAYYALNCSFLLDVKIFFKTLVVVIKRENTYKDTKSEMGGTVNIEQGSKK